MVPELKQKLQTGYEKERLSFVEDLLETPEYQNATKVLKLHPLPRNGACFVLYRICQTGVST